MKKYWKIRFGVVALSLLTSLTLAQQRISGSLLPSLDPYFVPLRYTKHQIYANVVRNSFIVITLLSDNKWYETTRSNFIINWKNIGILKLFLPTILHLVIFVFSFFFIIKHYCKVDLKNMDVLTLSGIFIIGQILSYAVFSSIMYWQYQILLFLVLIGIALYKKYKLKWYQIALLLCLEAFYTYLILFEFNI